MIGRFIDVTATCRRSPRSAKARSWPAMRSWAKHDVTESRPCSTGRPDTRWVCCRPTPPWSALAARPDWHAVTLRRLPARNGFFSVDFTAPATATSQSLVTNKAPSRSPRTSLRKSSLVCANLPASPRSVEGFSMWPAAHAGWCRRSTPSGARTSREKAPVGFPVLSEQVVQGGVTVTCRP